MNPEERARRDLINDLCDAAGLTRAQAEAIINSALRNGYTFGLVTA